MLRTIAISVAVYLLCTKVQVTSYPAVLASTKSPWEVIASAKELSKLKPCQINLLNKTVLPFLGYCYSGNCCIKQEQLFCPTYYEMVMLLNDTKQLDNVTKEQLQSLQVTKEDIRKDEVAQFCNNFASIVPKQVYNWNATDIKSSLKQYEYCEFVCFERNFSKLLDEVLFKVKPVCKLISWMADYIAKDAGSVNVNVGDNSPVNKVAENNNIPQGPAPDTEPAAKVVEAIKDKNIVTNSLVPLPKQTINKELKATNTDGTDLHKVKQLFKVEIMKDVNFHNETQNKGEIVSITGKGNDEKTQIVQGTAEENALIKSKNITTDNSEKGENDVNNPNAYKVDKEQPNENIIKAKNPPKQEEKQNDVNNELISKVGQGEKTVNNELAKAPTDPQNSENVDINPEDSDDIFQHEIPKSDPFYSNEEDNGNDDVRPPQADTKQTQKESPQEGIVDANSREVAQKAGVGVSAYYMPSSDQFYEEAGSNFFTYFLIGMFVCILLYVLYHNKTKVLALILEGRRSQSSRNGRRKHTAQYTKLDTNLEEAITSSASARSTQIIY